MTSLSALVSRAYPSPEWAVFFEVSDATGFRATRRADAVALGVWPSRGHAIVGFEFKEDRRDWLREKANPAKADIIAAHCDAWWVVAGRDGIVKPDELPDPWGLYIASEDRSKLKTVKPCQPFAGRDKSVMRRGFAAAMLRRVTETMVPRAEVDRLVSEAVQQAVDRTREGRELQMLRKQVEDMRGQIEAFADASGVDIRAWRGPAKIGAAVRAVLDSDATRNQLEHARKMLQAAGVDIDRALDEWPALEVTT